MLSPEVVLGLVVLLTSMKLMVAVRFEEGSLLTERFEKGSSFSVVLLTERFEEGSWKQRIFIFVVLFEVKLRLMLKVVRVWEAFKALITGVFSATHNITLSMGVTPHHSCGSRDGWSFCLFMEAQTKL